MTITVYRSDDASAPQLSGSVGSLTTLLDAILVNGYGSKSGAGWAIAFTATNQRAYRAASGNRMYLAIDDTNPAPASYGANVARVTSYETMSSATVGTKPMPTTQQLVQLSIPGVGALIFKSSAADATARFWIAFVSETFIHFQVFQANATTSSGFATQLGGTTMVGFMYGDLLQPQKAGDAYHTMLVAGTTNTVNNYPGGTLALTNTTLGHWLQRSYTQFGVAVQMGKASVTRGISAGTLFCSDTACPFFPDPVTGGFEQAETWVFEQYNTSQYIARGKVPGIYNPLHQSGSIAASFNFTDVITGAGAYAGINYMLCGPGNTSIATIQINGTW